MDWKKKGLAAAVAFALCAGGAWGKGLAEAAAAGQQQAQDDLDRAFDAYKARQLDKIAAWRPRSPLSGKAISRVFYPFGGPDILHALAFYPDADEYHLFGLEPVGKPGPAAELLSQKTKDANRKAFSDILAGSFFITKNMHAQEVSAAPVIAYFLSRSGKKIESAEYGSDWVKMVFSSGDKKQTVVYRRWDLSDKTLGASEAKRKALEELAGKDGTVSMLKAASYLCWSKEFSQIRDIVRKSPYVMEDTSGMPLVELQKTHETAAVGRYERPIRVFSNFEDKPLAEALSKSESLPFRYGYTKAGQAHLVFGVKRK